MASGIKVCWTPEEAALREFTLLQLVAKADAATQRLYIRRQRACAGVSYRPAPAHQQCRQQDKNTGDSSGQLSRRKLRNAERLATFQDKWARKRRARAKWQRMLAAVQKRARFDKLWQVHNDWYSEQVRPPPPLEKPEPMLVESISRKRAGADGGETAVAGRARSRQLVSCPVQQQRQQRHHARRTRRPRMPGQSRLPRPQGG